ncbi:MAG: hypothetical protein OEQ53_18345, partial [Saprospiraceae bacterium]|nr:hypothetical protein [Saprospiraceae bacterium]
EELTDADLKAEQAKLDADYHRLWRYLSSSDSLEIRNQKTQGLALSTSILHKVYYQNVADFLKMK